MYAFPGIQGLYVLPAAVDRKGKTNTVSYYLRCDIAWASRTELPVSRQRDGASRQGNNVLLHTYSVQTAHHSI